MAFLTDHHYAIKTPLRKMVVGKVRLPLSTYFTSPDSHEYGEPRASLMLKLGTLSIHEIY
jgi:hypothetical protein